MDRSRHGDTPIVGDGPPDPADKPERRPINEYWLDDPNAPYATFLSVLTSYLNPEVMDEEGLKERATTYADLDEMVTFKNEFREIIANPAVLRRGALRTAAYYEDGSEGSFLARLWRDLYGDEPPN